jgi:transposase
VWLAKLAERGMLRPSFVPPPAIRALRDYTRLSVEVTNDRSRVRQRMEKLLEDALIKLSSVATDIFGVSGRAMIEALTGRFDAHHAYLARMLLDQHDALTAQLDQLSTTIEQAIAAIPAAEPPAPAEPDADPETGELLPAGVSAIERLDEIPGIAVRGAQIVLAELGLDMSRFPTAGHLVSWAKLSPRTIQSGATNRKGKTGKGNPYLKGVLGEIATAAAKTDTFLGERYRRLVKRCGKQKALVAVARSILVIIWHLLSNPHARYHDLGADHHTTRIDKSRRTRNLVHQLQALGHTVTLTPAA